MNSGQVTVGKGARAAAQSGREAKTSSRNWVTRGRPWGEGVLGGRADSTST